MSGCEQQIALQLRLQPDRTQLGLVMCKAGRHLCPRLAPVVIFGYAGDDPQRDLARTVRFVVQPVRFLANQCTQGRVFALHARERGAELVWAEAALQADEARNVDVHDLLDMGQLPSHRAVAAGMWASSSAASSACRTWVC